MMMGGMGGSGGSMGMDMMNMGSGMNNMAGMSGSGSVGMQMQMPMQGMPMQGMMQNGYMQGMDPYAMAGNHGAMQGMNSGTGSLFGAGGFNSLLGGLLNLAIDIFAILLVVGLVVGAAVLIKRYLFEGDFFAPKVKTACTNCGTALNAEWSCCPKCGQSKVATQTVVTPNPQTV